MLSPWMAADEASVSHVLPHVVWWKKKEKKKNVCVYIYIYIYIYSNIVLYIFIYRYLDFNLSRNRLLFCLFFFLSPLSIPRDIFSLSFLQSYSHKRHPLSRIVHLICLMQSVLALSLRQATNMAREKCGKKVSLYVNEIALKRIMAVQMWGSGPFTTAHQGPPWDYHWQDDKLPNGYVNHKY